MFFVEVYSDYWRCFFIEFLIVFCWYLLFWVEVCLLFSGRGKVGSGFLFFLSDCELLRVGLCFFRCCVFSFSGKV